MGTSSVRVLVVDDHEPFRRWVCSTMRTRPEWHVIGEASDGLEAVQKVHELRPDVIVLDIGLPTLNGLDAARRIRTLAPESTILFLSQESSVEVAQAALSLGALGYVVKTHAGTELLAALEAVCQGKPFVSRGLAGHTFTAATNTHTPHRASHEEPLPSLETKEETTRRHEVQFYSDDASFLVGFTCFIEAALEAGTPVLLIATESHRDHLLERLKGQGLDVDAAIREGTYIALDVAETLSAFMVNDIPDAARFFEIADGLLQAAVKSAKSEPPRVAACGECASVLWAEGKADAAIRLEQLWDQIATIHEVHILCGYALSNVRGEEDKNVFRRICAEHSAVCSP